MNYFWILFFGTCIVLLIIIIKVLMSKTKTPLAPSVVLETKTITKGLQVDKLKEGSGPAVTSGKLVSVHYRALLQNGKEVDSSYEKGQPFQFTLGRREVIPGWEMGMVGMKVGEVRRFIIAPEHAYGSKGKGKVPPNAEIIFEVTLLTMS